MRVIVVRHHEVDSAGFIADSFAALGAELAVHLFPEDGPLPALVGADHIVVLGAKWSVYDHATIGDWIGAELDWLRQADAAGVPVLGICFGAQALSAALGGRVEPAPRQEVGWTTIESLEPESFRRARGWNFTRISACRRPARGCWPVTMWACRPSPSAGTWPSSSILR